MVRKLGGQDHSTWREVSQLSELQKGKTKNAHLRSTTNSPYLRHWRLPNRCSQPWLQAWRINRMFTSESSEVYSQWEGYKMRMYPSRGQTERICKSTWEKEAPHNTNGQWLVDLRDDHIHLPEQDPVNITMTDIQEKVCQ